MRRIKTKSVLSRSCRIAYDKYHIRKKFFQTTKTINHNIKNLNIIIKGPTQGPQFSRIVSIGDSSLCEIERKEEKPNKWQKKKNHIKLANLSVQNHILTYFSPFTYFNKYSRPME